jgi:hypothetical protein
MVKRQPADVAMEIWQPFFGLQQLFDRLKIKVDYHYRGFFWLWEQNTNCGEGTREINVNFGYFLILVKKGSRITIDTN